MIIDSGLLF